jgi:hypothetical protein
MTDEIYQTTKTITKEVVKEILEVEREEGLNAENIVEKARNKSSALHNFFEWDNTEAANQYRLHQGRMLINQVKIVVQNQTLYGFENVRVEVTGGDTERFYKPIMEILNNEEQRRELIKRALQAQRYWAEQYGKFSELKPIVVVIETTERKLLRKWQKQNKQNQNQNQK